MERLVPIHSLSIINTSITIPGFLVEVEDTLDDRLNNHSMPKIVDCARIDGINVLNIQLE